MRIQTRPLPSETTPPEIYARRRDFLKTAIGTGLIMAAGAVPPAPTFAAPASFGDSARKSPFSTNEARAR